MSTDTLIAIAVLAGLAVIGVVVYVLLQRRSNNRDQELRAFAQERGLSYDATEYLFDPAESLAYQLKQQQPEAMRDVVIPTLPLPVEELGRLPLLGTGVSRQIRNLMVGRHKSAELQIFDYGHRVELDEESSTEYRRSVVRLVSAQLALPPFVLAQKGPRNTLARRLSPSLAAQDLDLAAYPALQDKYVLSSADAQRARSLLTPPVVEFLANATPPFFAEGADNQLILYSGAGMMFLDAAALAKLHEQATTFYDLLVS
jgi:hypothetical protein